MVTKTYEILVIKHKITSKSIQTYNFILNNTQMLFFCSTKYISDSGRLSFRSATDSHSIAQQQSTSLTDRDSSTELTVNYAIASVWQKPTGQLQGPTPFVATSHERSELWYKNV